MHAVLLKLQRELAEGLSGLSAEQTQARRTPESWTIQQIIEHLLLTHESTTAAFDGRLKKGTPTLAKPALRQRLARFLITTAGIFPQGRLAPEPVRPPHPTLRAMSAVELNARIAELLIHMDASFNEAERLFGSKTTAVSHGMLGPMTVQQWRWFHFVHGEHHLRQILATRRALHL